MKNGTVIISAPLDVNLSGYSGLPATPNVTIVDLGNRTYQIGFSIQSGNNADVWELYQNGSLINNFQGFLSENGTNAQSASKTVTLAPGTYQFKVKLNNGFGSTESAIQTLIVQ
ncbi:hypothetical protein I6N90_07580 [Paenibacillus sp. GSMTC-2017]|uniref:hypothetical protein n=1 Tax=Paenibacillus sp. GSMTC-2017 TaxID=2794350 RepID=UPI0018D7CBC6|nr:hypothetical protein [Paenibacillus sp. GSMTC-2017]MBH5317660.1 hypothetical protein [Paenibacillus sp. GSMTC-2017]